jgi:hypothetical protein
MNMALVSIALTYIIAGLVGWVIAKKIKQRLSTAGWILLVVFTILAQGILPGTRVIAIFQFEMYANNILQGLLAGTLIGLLIKK